MTDFFSDEFIEQIKEFQRQRLEEREKILAEAITKYNFIVGSEDLKETLETGLLKGANIIYSPYIEDSTSIFAIKKFDIMDLLIEPQERSGEE